MARPSWNFGSRRLIHLEYESVLVSLEHLGSPISNTLDLSICSEWIPFIELNYHQVTLARSPCLCCIFTCILEFEPLSPDRWTSRAMRRSVWTRSVNYWFLQYLSDCAQLFACTHIQIIHYYIVSQDLPMRPCTWDEIEAVNLRLGGPQTRQAIITTLLQCLTRRESPS
jgi:hypothetical protein